MEQYLQGITKKMNLECIPIIAKGNYAIVNFEVQFFNENKPEIVTKVLHNFETIKDLSKADLTPSVKYLTKYFKESGLSLMQLIEPIGNITNNIIYFSPVKIEKRIEAVDDNSDVKSTRIFVTGFFYPQETHNKIYKV